MRRFWPILLLLGCVDEKSPIDPQLVALYADLRVATIEYAQDTTQMRLVRQNLLKQANMTYKKFHLEIDEIRNNPEKWVRFQNQLVDHLDSLRKQAQIATKGKNKHD